MIDRLDTSLVVLSLVFRLARALFTTFISLSKSVGLPLIKYELMSTSLAPDAKVAVESMNFLVSIVMFR